MPAPAGMNAARLGTALATAAGSVDAPGIAKWNAIAAAILQEIQQNAKIEILFGAQATGVTVGAGTAPISGQCSIT